MKSKIIEKFGLIIKELRISEKLSQEELADLTGFHRTYIGMIERGERNLSLINIERFAKAFKLTPSQLLNKIDLKKRTKS